MDRSVIEVVRNPLGWWDVRSSDGHVEVRYLSEFQAWEAGRALAEEREADLIIHEQDGPPRYEAFDPATGTVRSIVEVLSSSARAPAASQKRPLILLVEDGLDARELYAEYLTYAGFGVATAVDGREAIRLARLLRPDVIVMDIRMPGMDGVAATADLKTDPDLSHIPVIAVTADASEEAMRSATGAGCAAFVVKPILPKDLATCVTQVLAGETPHVSQITGEGADR